MITKWNKGTYTKLSDNFSSFEFECKCKNCKQQMIDTDLIDKIQNIRNILQIPLQISSGYRCPAHQEELKHQGYTVAVGTSTHTQGIAADILLPTKEADKERLLTLCRINFSSVGIAKTFVHVDLRSERRRFWVYE